MSELNVARPRPEGRIESSDRPVQDFPLGNDANTTRTRPAWAASIRAWCRNYHSKEFLVGTASIPSEPRMKSMMSLRKLPLAKHVLHVHTRSPAKDPVHGRFILEKSIEGSLNELRCASETMIRMPN